jgi:hypothetical protein
MEARLTGPGFQITAVSPEEQPITSKGTTEWRWDVKATTDGKQALHLTLAALFTVEGRDARRAIRTLDRTIEVEVKWSQRIAGFVGNNWKWLWTALVVPLAPVIWGARNRWAGNTPDSKT